MGLVLCYMLDSLSSYQRYYVHVLRFHSIQPLISFLSHPTKYSLPIDHRAPDPIAFPLYDSLPLSVFQPFVLLGDPAVLLSLPLPRNLCGIKRYRKKTAG